MRKEKKNLGADAAEVVTAEPVAAIQLSHAAPWHVQGSVIKCDVGGFKMVWSALGGPPVAYVAALNDAHLIAAAPELLARLRQIHAGMNCICKFLPYVGKEAPCEVCQIEALIAKAEGW